MVPKITITVDGSSVRDDGSSATAGFGVVVSIDGRRILEVQRALCPTCDEGAQTNNRAQLRATQWALHFLHEVAKLGFASHVRGANPTNDGRPMRGGLATGLIRSDSTYVLSGLKRVNRRNRTFEYKDLWEEIRSTKACLERNGMRVTTTYVLGHACDLVSVATVRLRGHAGDRLNDRADVLAKNAAIGGRDDDWACCSECDLEFTEGDINLVHHFKEMHLGRNLQLETEFFGNNRFGCTYCKMTTKTERALIEHHRDKHDTRPVET